MKMYTMYTYFILLLMRNLRGKFQTKRSRRFYVVEVKVCMCFAVHFRNCIVTVALSLLDLSISVNLMSSFQVKRSVCQLVLVLVPVTRHVRYE